MPGRTRCASTQLGGLDLGVLGLDLLNHRHVATLDEQASELDQGLRRQPRGSDSFG